MQFSDGGDMSLRPLSWTADTWTTVDGSQNFWDNRGGTCGFLFGVSYETALACHAGATITDGFIVTDSGWVVAPYTHYIDDVSYEGESVGVTCNGLAPTITGSGTINGTAGNDVILGSEGADTINGRGGNDVICALGGTDVVDGAAGADIILGGPDDDRLWAAGATTTCAAAEATTPCVAKAVTTTWPVAGEPTAASAARATPTPLGTARR